MAKARRCGSIYCGKHKCDGAAHHKDKNEKRESGDDELHGLSPWAEGPRKMHWQLLINRKGAGWLCGCTKNATGARLCLITPSSHLDGARHRAAISSAAMHRLQTCA